jgi:hypothetical protein
MHTVLGIRIHIWQDPDVDQNADPQVKLDPVLDPDQAKEIFRERERKKSNVKR